MGSAGPAIGGATLMFKTLLVAIGGNQ